MNQLTTTVAGRRSRKSHYSGIDPTGDQPDQNGDGNKVKPVFPEYRAGFFLPVPRIVGKGPHARDDGTIMHLHHDPEIEQNGGNDGGQSDFQIGNARHVHHEKGGRAHDGRHERGSGAGRRGNSAGKVCSVAETLHQRDGDAARGHHIGNRRPGKRAVQRGSDDTDFGGTAAHASGNGRGEAEKEVAAARRVEHLPEQHEHEDIGTGHAHRRAEDAVIGIGHAVKKNLQRCAAVPEIAGQIRSGKAVGNEHEDNAQQHRPHGTARHFQHQQHQRGGDGPVHGKKRIHSRPAINNILAVQGEPYAEEKTCARQNDVGKRNLFLRSARSGGKEGGVAEKGQRKGKRDKDAAQDEGIDKTEGRAVYFHSGEQKKQRSRDLRPERIQLSAPPLLEQS